MPAPQQGDALIRHSSDSEFEVVDAITFAFIARTPSLVHAINLAASRGGAVWRQNLDNRRRILNDPTLLLPRLRG